MSIPAAALTAAAPVPSTVPCPPPATPLRERVAAAQAAADDTAVPVLPLPDRREDAPADDADTPGCRDEGELLLGSAEAIFAVPFTASAPMRASGRAFPMDLLATAPVAARQAAGDVAGGEAVLPPPRTRGLSRATTVPQRAAVGPQPAPLGVIASPRPGYAIAMALPAQHDNAPKAERAALAAVSAWSVPASAPVPADTVTARMAGLPLAVPTAAPAGAPVTTAAQASTQQASTHSPLTPAPEAPAKIAARTATRRVEPGDAPPPQVPQRAATPARAPLQTPSHDSRRTASQAAATAGSAPVVDTGTRITVPFTRYGPGHQVTAHWGGGSAGLRLHSSSERSHRAVVAALEQHGVPGHTQVEASHGMGDDTPSRGGPRYLPPEEDA
ncbi:hypothetical protein [Stenotrophomonas sp. NPDC077659]|uniref:hypothetical protein n=1 Tax=Stenotrophomonas sp. NPDC077659 TaxID=3390694 RepID=UPI003D03BA35